MKHVMKILNNEIGDMKYVIERLQESNQTLYEEVTRLTKENQKLKKEPILNKIKNK